jgi:outer membrane protein TolC
MIKTHSDDPDVAAAAREAAHVVAGVLNKLPTANTFDYGGHRLALSEYGLCTRCTAPIAEAQQAAQALQEKAEATDDTTVAEHIQLAADMMRLEAEVAVIRAELHSGQHSEAIVDQLLGFLYDRSIHDSYDHTHKQDAQ